MNNDETYQHTTQDKLIFNFFFAYNSVLNVYNSVLYVLIHVRIFKTLLYLMISNDI